MMIAQKDPSGFVRLSAMEALAQLQPFPKEALPVLIKALSDMDEGVRGGAADSLGMLKSVSQPAIPTLKRLARR